VHADYHQVTDEAGRVDAAGGARIAWLAYRLLRETMETSSPPRYRRPDPAFNVSSMLRLVIRFGVFPEENTQRGRYPLVRFVTPGSLASQYGLQTGDEITALNGSSFERIEDAAVVFGRLRLDGGLRVSVLRKGTAREVRFPAECFKDLAGPTIRPLGAERYEVLFRYRPGTTAKAVALAGSFNGWSVTATPMAGPDREGFYAVRLTLDKGFHEYKFVVDGKAWWADPSNMRTTGRFNNSVLVIGEMP
jgi:hypothetical protein